MAIPDAVPTAMLPGPGLLSMTAGDFVEVYAAPAQAGAFDCVATCFFLARPPAFASPSRSDRCLCYAGVTGISDVWQLRLCEQQDMYRAVRRASEALC